MAEPFPDDPTAEVFLLEWIRPSDALRDLHAMGRGHVVAEIYRRLSTGMLYAAGTVSALDASSNTDPRSVLISEWWKSASRIRNAADAFWVTGGIAVEDRRRSSSLPPRTFEFFGVRFEPNGLQRVANDAGVDARFSKPSRLAAALSSPHPVQAVLNEIERVTAYPGPTESYNPRPMGTLDQIAPELAAFKVSPAPAPAPTGRQGSSTSDYVAEKEVVAWFDALAPNDQTRGFRWLWNAVRAAFAPRRVYKKHVLPFVKDRPLGRPKNVPNNVPS
jgi:hypothetical protein